jgi:hypothetical protein
MAQVVYVLCAVTSIVAAALLLRAYDRSRFPLLLWSGICFVGLALNNVLLFVDLVLVPEVDLSFWRKLPAVAGVLALLHGLVKESR